MVVVWGSELEACLSPQDGVIDCERPSCALQDGGGNPGGLVVVFEEAVVEHHLEEIASLRRLGGLPRVGCWAPPGRRAPSCSPSRELSPSLRFRVVDDVNLLIEDVHELMIAGLPARGLLRPEQALWLLMRIDIDLHEGFDEALDGLLVGLVLHGVLVDERHDALLEDPLGHDVLGEREKLVEDREDLLVEAVGDVVDDAVELVQEEVLQVWVVRLAVFPRIDVLEDDFEELQHRLRRAVLAQVL